MRFSFDTAGEFEPPFTGASFAGQSCQKRSQDGCLAHEKCPCYEIAGIRQQYQLWGKGVFAASCLVSATSSLIQEAEAHLSSFGYAKTAPLLLSIPLLANASRPQTESHTGQMCVGLRREV